MDALLFRTRVAVLWLAVAIATSASLLLHLFVPGALEELLAGEIEGQTLTDAVGYGLAMLVVIPLVMAAVTLLVPDRVNRWVNLIAGLASGLFGVFGVVSHLVDGGFNVHVLMVAVAGVGAFLIAGLSLAGLRRPTSQPAAPASEPSRDHEATTV
jgi:MFS family permease